MGQPAPVQTTVTGGIQRQAYSEEEIKRRIAEIEAQVSIQNFPEEEEKRLNEERNAQLGEESSRAAPTVGVAEQFSEEELVEAGLIATALRSS